MSWQKDLVKDITNYFSYDPKLDDVTSENIESAVDNLNIRERFIIRSIYKDHKTQKEVADLMGITSSRISEIKRRCYRRLMHPYMVNIMRYGLEEADNIKIEREVIAKKEAQEEERLKNMPPELDDFIEDKFQYFVSTRTYNCIRRNFERFEDLKNTTVEELSEISNMGPKSVKEVVDFMSATFRIQIK